MSRRGHNSKCKNYKHFVQVYASSLWYCTTAIKQKGPEFDGFFFFIARHFPI